MLERGESTPAGNQNPDPSVRGLWMNDLSHLTATMGKDGGTSIEKDRDETYSDSPIRKSSSVPLQNKNGPGFASLSRRQTAAHRASDAHFRSFTPAVPSVMKGRKL